MQTWRSNLLCTWVNHGSDELADRVYSLGRGVCSIRGEATTDTRFIKYCLDWKLEALLKYAGGGTFPNLTQDTIRDFEIPFPEHRRKIAAILSAYDDLIENNLQRIKILEEIAQNLYREWFVKFRFPGHQHARFTDEAHRTQYDTLALNMRTALPNASFLAFTGTPLIVSEEKTRQVFGDYISVYDFQ
jgi:restriction endonuclease S subunit